jgi:glycosyltransferase involved in cell wall biosynthesis
LNRKKILISIDWFLPGTASGGPVRSYANLIAHLKDDFEFLIITRNTDFGSDEPYKDITPNTWIPFNPYTKVFYVSPENINQSYLKVLFQQIEFDVAYINGMYSRYFSILPVRFLKKLNKPVIVSARGMLNPQAFSVKGKKKKVYLKLAKLLAIYKDVVFHATNADEAKCIKNEIGHNTMVLIANNFPRKIDPNLKTKPVLLQPIQLVSMARISVEKGTLKTLKALKVFGKPIVLDLYGPIYDVPYWEKCQEVIADLPDYIQVNYKGIVNSENVPRVLSAYDFFILLSEGENFGHAILEALSVGLPVFISDKTPWKNLTTQSLGWDINNNAISEIVEALNQAIDMPNTLYAQWSEACVTYAKSFTENPELLEQNKALFLKVLNQ